MTIDLQSLANNPIITIGGFALGIIGIVLAVIFYARSKKDRVPCFEVNSNTLIEGLHKALDGLQLHYKGTPQERITVTKLAFWNAGRETIDKRDLVETDPIGIACPSTLAILDIQVTQVSAKSNSVKLGGAVDQGDVHFYPIDFEYLDNKDYFVIQIVHSGKESEHIEVKGKIKGVKEIVKTTDAKIDKRFFKLIPFAFGLEKMLSSRVFMKYGGSFSYIGFGVFGIWSLFQGYTSWYVWMLTAFCFFAAIVMFYGHRHIAPVKI